MQTARMKSLSSKMTEWRADSSGVLEHLSPSVLLLCALNRVEDGGARREVSTQKKKGKN